MFCIYSFDFIKKNTDPQLKMFTPSKFLSRKFHFWSSPIAAQGNENAIKSLKFLDENGV